MRLSSGLRIAVLLLVLPVSPSFAGGGDPQVYGDGVSGQDTIPISVLLEDADDYVDQVVRVAGVVTAVCEKAGCWMTLATAGGDDEVRIKVNDGVIVFPPEAKGRHAIAEGRFVKIEMTLDETIAYKQHHAEEQGEEFDPASVTEPMVFYQIRGTGAVIR
jgi:hypothetical protein